MAATQEMTNTFGATSTTEDVLTGINLTGKRILVTVQALRACVPAPMA
jgi:hypothetical protein